MEADIHYRYSIFLSSINQFSLSFGEPEEE
jgi:hypothetical protein